MFYSEKNLRQNAPRHNTFHKFVSYYELSNQGWIMTTWVRACDAVNIENWDVVHFDYQGKAYALFRPPEDEYFCGDGYFTHEDVHLANSLVVGHIIERPGQNGKFYDRTQNLHI